MRDGDFYEVEEGDTLTKISERFMVKVDNLMKWNPDIIDEDKIDIGQKIRIVDPDEGVKYCEVPKDRFQVCVGRVLNHEGGSVDDEDDPGGRTNHGISQPIFKAMQKDNLTRAKDVYDITVMQAIDAYRKYFWEPVKCDRFPVGVDYFLFDSAVQHGEGIARKWAKRVETSSAVGALEFLRTKREGFYEAIIKKRPQSEKYRMGWMRRLQEVYEAAVEDAEKWA